MRVLYYYGGILAALLGGALLCGCRPGQGDGDRLVIGLHESVGPINPLGRGNRPSLAVQRLQLPALIEYAGRSGAAGRRRNLYRPSLADSSRGGINWHYKRKGGIVAKFRLRQTDWFDPRTGGWSDAGVLTANQRTYITLPAKPTDNDWALKLTAL